MSEFVATILAPCMSEEPTAGAVIVTRDASAAAYTLINMGPLEAIHTLRGAADQIESGMGGNMGVMQ